MNHNGIWLEKFKREDGKYLTDESTITYILDNCSSKVIPYCKGKIVYEVTVGIDEDDECDCDECDECDGCEEGFTVNGRPVSKEEFDAYVSQFKHDEKPTTSSATYKVNGEEVDKETFDSALAKIEDKYFDNVRDMLLGYCEIMDEMNTWRSRLFW